MTLQNLAYYVCLDYTLFGWKYRSISHNNVHTAGIRDWNWWQRSNIDEVTWDEFVSLFVNGVNNDNQRWKSSL